MNNFIFKSISRRNNIQCVRCVRLGSCFDVKVTEKKLERKNKNKEKKLTKAPLENPSVLFDRVEVARA